MRVIAGQYKGHNLKALKGDTTRPTTDRAKESLFSSIISQKGSLEGSIVLDAFAGSGALGIEALSRGAALVVFCEKSRQAANIVRENLAKVKAPKERYLLELGDTAKLLKKMRPRPFDLVFFDPPYAFRVEEVFALIEGLSSSGQLAPDALICYEMAKKNKDMCLEQASLLKWEAVSTKDLGDTSIVILKRGE